MSLEENNPIQLPEVIEIVTLDKEGNFTGTTFTPANEQPEGSYLWNGYIKKFYEVKRRGESEFLYYAETDPRDVSGSNFKAFFLLLGIDIESPKEEE